MNKQTEQEFLVLVADDSENDRLLLNLAMRQATRLRVIAEVTNGAGVIDYLQGNAEFADRKKFPLPDLLLLDLDMPVKNGFEVLTWIGREYLENLKVVVLTDSMDPSHIKRALDLGADHFQVKPSAVGDLESVILALEDSLLSSLHVPLRHAHSTARMA
jgi:CheY-like chemotaxis protein